MTIYTKTATKAKTKTQTIFAFGRETALDGHPVEKGGYQVWKLCENYDGQVKGGIRKTWRYVAKDLSFNDAVELLNRRVRFKAFNQTPSEAVNKDCRND
jgi:hypothetical protein